MLLILANRKWIITTDLKSDPRNFEMSRILPGTDYPDFGDRSLYGQSSDGEENLLLSVENQGRQSAHHEDDYWRIVNSAMAFNETLVRERAELKERVMVGKEEEPLDSTENQVGDVDVWSD